MTTGVSFDDVVGDREWYSGTFVTLACTHTQAPEIVRADSRLPLPLLIIK